MPHFQIPHDGEDFDSFNSEEKNHFLYNDNEIIDIGDAKKE